MLIIANVLEELNQTYREEDIICCFTKVEGMFAIMQQVILLLNTEKVIVLFIHFSLCIN